MKEFVVFWVLVELLKENDKEYFLYEVYECCKVQEYSLKEDIINEVQVFYDEFDYEIVLDKIVEIVLFKGIELEIKVIY